jgi:hypothetical protein
MRFERSRSQRIQIRHRFGIDRDGNAASAETLANAETVSVAQVGACKIDIFVADAAQLILPA